MRSWTGPLRNATGVLNHRGVSSRSERDMRGRCELQSCGVHEDEGLWPSDVFEEQRKSDSVRSEHASTSTARSSGQPCPGRWNSFLGGLGGGGLPRLAHRTHTRRTTAGSLTLASLVDLLAGERFHTHPEDGDGDGGGAGSVKAACPVLT